LIYYPLSFHCRKLSNGNWVCGVLFCWMWLVEVRGAWHAKCPRGFRTLRRIQYLFYRLYVRTIEHRKQWQFLRMILKLLKSQDVMVQFFLW
jgi:hypothetical protein